MGHIVDVGCGVAAIRGASTIVPPRWPSPLGGKDGQLTGKTAALPNHGLLANAGSYALELPRKRGEPLLEMQTDGRRRIAAAKMYRRVQARSCSHRNDARSKSFIGGRDLGIGTSTRKRWRQMRAEHDLLSGPHEDMRLERARRGRKENALQRQEGDLLKKPRLSSFGRQDDEVWMHRYAEGRDVSSTPARLSASVVTMHGNSVRLVAAS